MIQLIKIIFYMLAMKDDVGVGNVSLWSNWEKYMRCNSRKLFFISIFVSPIRARAYVIGHWI